LAAATGISIHQTIALEAFASEVVPGHMWDQLVPAFQELAVELVAAGNKTLTVVMDELQGNGFKWLQFQKGLGKRMEILVSSVAVGNESTRKSSRKTSIEQVGQAWRMIMDDVLQKQVCPRLKGFEHSMRKLLGNFFAPKIVERAKKSVQVMKAAIAKLAKVQHAADRCLGAVEGGSHHGSAEVFSLYMAMVASNVEDVKTELSESSLSAAHCRMVRRRVEHMGVQVEEAAEALGFPQRGRMSAASSLAGDGGGRENGLSSRASDEAKGAVKLIRSALHRISDSLHRDTVPSRAAMQEIHADLDKILASCEAITKFQQELFQLAPRTGEVSQWEKGKAEQDIRARARRPRDEAAFQEAVVALCTARRSSWLVATVAREIRAATDRADGIVAMMSEANFEGQRMLKKLKKARKNSDDLSSEDLRQLQDDAVESATGCPAQVLMHLYDVTSEPVGKSFSSLREEIEYFQTVSPKSPSAKRSRKSSAPRHSVSSSGSEGGKEPDLRRTAATVESARTCDSIATPGSIFDTLPSVVGEQP